MLDLAHHPNLGNMPTDAWAAIDQLLPRCDQKLLDQIATDQGRRAALTRIRRRKQS